MLVKIELSFLTDKKQSEIDEAVNLLKKLVRYQLTTKVEYREESGK